MATIPSPDKKKRKKIIKKLFRSYKGPDWYLTEQSQTLCDLFEKDKNLFAAFDSTYQDPFRQDVWQAAINAVVNYKDDTTIVAEVEEKTDVVALQMQTARNKYSEIMYFAQKVFGRSNVVLQQFGKGKKYREAYSSRPKLYGFLDALHQAANKHKVKLGTVGCSQAMIDDIATVRDMFNDSNLDQNLLKNGRPEISQERVKVNNALHKITMQVVTAARSVFKTNPAKLAEYVYRPPIKKRSKKID